MTWDKNLTSLDLIRSWRYTLAMTQSQPPSMILTLDAIRERKAARNARVRAIGDLQLQIGRDDEWIRAALLVLGVDEQALLNEPDATVDAARSVADSEATFDGDDEAVDMTEHTKKLLADFPNGLNSSALRLELSKVPALASRLTASPSYFYTMTSRLTRRGVLAKVGDRFVLAKFAPKMETTSPAFADEVAEGSGVSAPDVGG